jgi:lysophospholipid acyltransferase (LPLAT)-like uncharacterized protein
MATAETPEPAPAPPHSRLAALGLALLGWTAALLLRALGATWRVRSEGPNPLVPGHPALVAAFWHRNVLIASHHYRGRGFSAAVSRSRDGDRIAAMLSALGYHQPPRGSSTRGGAAALHELVRLVRSGTTVSIQPDGPQGPARVSKIGIVTLARLTGQPITPVGFSATPCLRFHSWDGTVLPLPFARVACRYGEPIHVPEDADEALEERLRRELDARLDALTNEVDTRLGLPPEGSGTR